MLLPQAPVWEALEGPQTRADGLRLELDLVEEVQVGRLLRLGHHRDLIAVVAHWPQVSPLASLGLILEHAGGLLEGGEGVHNEAEHGRRATGLLLAPAETLEQADILDRVIVQARVVAVGHLLEGHSRLHLPRAQPQTHQQPHQGRTHGQRRRTPPSLAVGLLHLRPGAPLRLLFLLARLLAAWRRRLLSPLEGVALAAVQWRPASMVGPLAVGGELETVSGGRPRLELGPFERGTVCGHSAETGRRRGLLGAAVGLERGGLCAARRAAH